MAQRPIIYEPHPVTPERKAELRAAGYQIIDAVFAPADYVHPDADEAADGDQRDADDEPRRRGRPPKSREA